MDRKKNETVSRKSEVVFVRLTKGEKAALVAAAEGSGTDLSKYIRSVSLSASGDYYTIGSRSLIETLLRIERQLKLIGNRNSQAVNALNRIAYAVDQGFIEGTAKDDLAKFAATYKPVVLKTQEAVAASDSALSAAIAEIATRLERMAL